MTNLYSLTLNWFKTKHSNTNNGNQLCLPSHGGGFERNGNSNTSTQQQCQQHSSVKLQHVLCDAFVHKTHDWTNRINNIDDLRVIE